MQTGMRWLESPFSNKAWGCTCRIHHEACVQNGMRWLEGTFPDKARGWVGFNVPMSHKITAACDLQLMPSRFEPCGLNQLYAMRYGAVPIAHETGGLKDTVLPFKPFDGGCCWLARLPDL